MDYEKDILLFSDEDGQLIEMEVLDYFIHNDQEYALLSPVSDEEDDAYNCSCDCGCNELYIMKVVVNGDTEEFVPVDEDKMEELIEAVETMYSEDNEDYDEIFDFFDDHNFDEED